MEKKSDETIELESEVILRVPKEAGAVLRKLIKKGDKEQISIKLENDIRRGEVVIGNHHLNAKVVDLPTIIEGHKTIDNTNLYKTADICQMIICNKYEDILSEDDDREKVKNKKESNKVDKKYLWPHGITPPLKNVRSSRFRKILRKEIVEAPEIEKEVRRLLKADYEAHSIKWEVVSETEVENNTKYQEELFMQGESYNDIVEKDIFGEATSDSDEEANDINIMDMDEDMMSTLTNDNSNFSETNSFMDQKPSISGTQKIVTEFTKRMFISDDDSHDEIKKKNSMGSTFDESMGYRDDILKSLKSELELSDDGSFDDNKPVLETLFPVKVDNSSADNIQHQIDQLLLEIKELKERKIQHDLVISNIENINLKQRFISISNNLLSEQQKKEQQIQELLSLLF